MNPLILVIPVLLLVGFAVWSTLDLRRLRKRHQAEMDTLAATVAKMQADIKPAQRAANAPPVAAFSFKGVAGR